MPEDPIVTEGVVREIVSARLCRAVLKNGKLVLAFPGKAAEAAGLTVAVGDRVELELTPYDFSKARIARRLEV